MMPDRRSLLRRICRCVALTFMLAMGAGPGLADAIQALRAALSRADMGDWAGARAAAKGAVAADLVEWRRLRAGAGTLAEVEAFLARRADWPGLALIRQKAEALLAQAASPAQVTAFFGEGAPVTATGSIALARALAQVGRQAEAEAEAVRAWVTFAFDADEEAAILANFAQALEVAHEVRLDRLLWQGRAPEVRRMLARVPAGWQALAAARMGVRADAPGVNALIAAVPPDLLSDPGLIWERFAWRMRRDRYAEAGALIVAQSTSVAALGDPDVWADRRALLARRLLRDGDAATAYRVAASHFLTRGADFADLEFVAGFAALRHLGDPATALRHFERLQAAVTTPISLARAHYWQARAQEALGDLAAAEVAFRAAAAHPGAYYGLLAAERLGLPLDPSVLAQAPAPDWGQAAFAGSPVLEAARLLAAAGDRAGAKRFFLHLAEDLNRTELAQLSDLALEIDEPHIALLIAKQAAERGVILPRAYHPVSAMVPDGLAVSRALALAIARRESEFDPEVVSPAGAKGLMQVMPGTARLMAAETGLPYVEARLTSDPAYNVAMGSAYVRVLVAEFGSSIALVASGYNAGPGRPRAWITQFGDPRRPEVDVVDWVETIPFAETRTYVMRVVESLVIYRAILRGSAGPVNVTGELKG